MDFIKGVIVPILTPIDEDERIDEAKMRDQVDYVIEGGVLGILAFGSNGEFYQVEEDEMERGLKIMIDQAAGRVPVYFGIGAINTKKMLPTCANGTGSGCSRNFCPAADVFKAHGRGIVSAFSDNCTKRAGAAYAAVQ